MDMEWLRSAYDLEKAAQALKIPFEIPAYFQEPVGYLASATKFTRFDRYADAICQTEK